MCITNKLAQICSYQRDHCAILITPPDKSLLLCFDATNQLVTLYGSHTHSNNGGLIAVTSYSNIHNLIMKVTLILIMEDSLQSLLIQIFTT